MGVICAVARNSFLEALRDKVLYLLVVFGVFNFAVSRLLSPLALGEGRRITIDMGLTSISLFGCLIAIFVGHQMIFREVERKTLYFVFARPVRRWQFLCGKFLGLVLTLALCVVSMGGLLLLVLQLSGYAWGPAILQAFFFKILELSVLAAVAVLIAAFTTPILAGLFTLAAFLVGHGSGELVALLGSLESPVAEGLVRGMSWVVPRLDLFHGVAPVLTGEPWPLGHVIFGVGYALLYVAGCLVFASLVLTRRELAI